MFVFIKIYFFLMRVFYFSNVVIVILLLLLGSASVCIYCLKLFMDY